MKRLDGSVSGGGFLRPRPAALRCLSAAIPLAFAAACAPGGAPAAAAPAGACPAPPPMWERAGLDGQARMDWLVANVPADMPFEPATGPWTAAAIPAGVSAAASPAAAVQAVANALGWTEAVGLDVWEQTVRVWPEDEDRATAVLLQWGLQDDAVAGRDLRAVLTRGAGGWTVASLEERYHCARALSADGLCA